MGGPVQSSLHKLMNKPSKHRCSSRTMPAESRTSAISVSPPLQYLSHCRGRRAGSGTQQQSKLKRPSLLSRLSQSSSEQPVSPAATQQRQEAAANACSLPQTTEQHNDNSATTSWTCDEDSRTGLCPVCGLDLPVSLLQAHVEAELSLMINSNDSCMAPASADSNQMPPQKAHACPSARRDARTDRLRPTTSRQHPASQQKVPSVLQVCTLYCAFATTRHLLLATFGPLAFQCCSPSHLGKACSWPVHHASHLTL